MYFEEYFSISFPLVSSSIFLLQPSRLRLQRLAE